MELGDEFDLSAQETGQSLQSLEKQEVNLRAAVLQRIRLEIVSGEAQPRTVFSVPSLAKRLGTSTTPVREALLELAASGLVEPLKNRGFRVLEASLQDLRSVFALRVELEVFGVRTLDAAALRADADLERIADVIADAVEHGNVQRYVTADRAFHHRLVSLAGNRFLTDMVMQLRDNMRLYGLDSAAGLVRQHNSVAEHFRLIELLKAGDPGAAASLMKQHIIDWEPVFSAAIAKAAPPDASAAA